MRLVEKITGSIYLIVLGLCIGGIVLCAISAATIFDSNAILRINDLSNSILTRFDEGIIMTKIFERFGYILNISAIIILVYESLSFKLQKSGFLLWLLGILNAILMFLFTFYYINKIVTMQNEGASVTAGVDFNLIHKQSEVVFKVLLVTLIVAFIARVFVLASNKVAEKRPKKRKLGCV
ncbi:hypothetical protein BKH43_02705 [Helicobacter sp. 13S00401-1]|uniref:DUF4149 domain-containing protein n=1 Tax=Helicobacter sp. 13S00401-1 TaxID=1905758 RepID=UPI000BA5C47B|nr:DUF4149 domain-containing protein [Helicobacter sp. 13S00401-1]PAF51134.1 hypothetical protein BKH43_02705 [Helicobacter sp. 13S00401-1]